jgi:trans-2,3-dihydro-3-hydroxyanthranilate isomerase
VACWKRHRCGEGRRLKTDNRKFLVVNAFADVAFGGNPAAVFPSASGLETTKMKALARQLNLVETVFVLPAENAEADFQLRYFTPEGEIAVAGHPTIAAWVALLQQGIVDAKERTSYTQVNRAGIQQIEINCQNGSSSIVTMKQPPPKFLDTKITARQVADIFSISVNDIDPDLPIQAVDTGLGHLIVPLKSLDALMRVKRNIEALRGLCQSLKIREAQLFCFETIDKTSDLHTRNICPREGLEDPACGVGTGALASYLSKFYWANRPEIKLKMEQGNIVHMPSMIHTKTIREGNSIEIFVGGSGIVMLEGHFLI